MRKEIIELIHAGHQGITKSRERANSSVWWPKMSEEITQRVRNCRICEEKKPTQNSEPLKPTLLPDRAFQMVGADICEFKGDQYLIVSDYFSRYIEIAHLKNANSFCVIQSMKNIFARHGIPEKVVTDNGRQFVSSEFQNFADKWNFVHTTSSPYFPQSNGQAERAVQIAKRILQQEDPFLALLSYRTTATSPTAVSPAELAMGRKL